jgi:hypothetical protein
MSVASERRNGKRWRTVFRVEIILDALDGPEIAAFLSEHIEEMRSDHCRWRASTRSTWMALRQPDVNVLVGRTTARVLVGVAARSNASMTSRR